ncbi:LuxR C-terminal-related transcriptional regulator [Tamlana sp. 62-3]|uniref:LuxR C-terminal-related transcriptional regulator n=1 Tax=Neotamlana sargassicola TaxID=2883125 RepID=A0A9X1I4P4_9FLAO|nr:LuxR C-terminal-related transcriptional regulator [Tamlana sargassicola]MCB4807253.1 LuxR C-terminal-related transcriptional regulator [Tamlana sargassicola]
MKLTKFLSFVAVMYSFFIVTAQERPPIQIFTPSQYGAENQNWSISQDQNKSIFIANNKGLLEFNGAKWRVYNSPNKTIIRSVAVINNIIYSGSFREFGFWERDNYGNLNYTSLSQQLNIPFLEDEELWNIIGIDDYVLFQSLNRIYIYNTKNNNYSIINSKETIYRLFKVDDSIYFQKLTNGLFEIANGEARLVSDHNVIKKNLLVNVFKKNNKLFFLTEDNGFYYLENNEIVSWQISASSSLEKLRIYSSKKLEDGSFVLGSISDGILLLSPTGEILHKINQKSGLSNNTVLSVFEDVENNIWLGLENGINCVNIKSPFSIYNDTEGHIGAVNASVLHENYLYIGTNQGLFYKRYKSNENFKFINGTQGAVWCLNVIDNQLFCGHNSGTFLVSNNQASLISSVQGTWDIKKLNDSILIQGNYTGLYLLEKGKNTWKLRNKIEDFNISSRYFEVLNGKQVFVSHEYKGVFNITLNNTFTKAVKISQEAIETGLKTSLIKYKNNIYYSQISGVYKYNKSNKSFKRDSIFSQLFNKNEYISGKLIVDKRTNKLWATSLSGLSYLSSSKLSDTPKINHIAIPSHSRNDVTGYENITHLEENKFLYGNSTGYIIFNLEQVKQKPFKVYLNQVVNSAFKNRNDSLIFVNTNKAQKFKYANNNIRFTFSVPEYQKYAFAEYQYQLEGMRNMWSNWTKKPEEFFENLPHGNYTFKVRAKIDGTLSTNTESYSFSILRPWYISNTMIVCYGVMVLLFSWFMHNQYKRSFKKQQKKLIIKKQRELELKELENKEQLTRFKNDKLQQDIENKNRELGISTMNLIKKNEFLNNLKKELQNVNDVKSIKRVINIIDKNINNTDDWHVFEEAFNNADKDFLKKIKQLHPELTSNDLRLCAYLRLNLASKEIAPLLNISPRSVEVKRYRLRKKMNLKHEASLTDYILSV